VKAPAYDRMGIDYSEVRRADPRFEAAIWAALGDAQSVLNVGAGAGSYEPRDREVIAVEPSPVMIAQRPPDAAPAIRGVAEALPLEDDSVDATMGVFTMQHWDDVDRGLSEVLRVEAIPVPRDCADGFCIALWSRPEAHLDPNVRRSSSIWHLLPATVVEPALDRLSRDLESGEWERRYGKLREKDSLDVGLRIAIAELR
jgi:SAM-dependent methyltransferase